MSLNVAFTNPQLTSSTITRRNTSSSLLKAIFQSWGHRRFVSILKLSYRVEKANLNFYSTLEGQISLFNPANVFIFNFLIARTQLKTMRQLWRSELECIESCILDIVDPTAFCVIVEVRILYLVKLTSV